MGILDSIKGALGGSMGSLSTSALPGLINQVYPGGLPAVLEKLQQNGYGQQVSSWLGHGPNDPINGADLQSILSNQHIQDLERHFGIPADQVLDTIAKILPGAVDEHSPNGTLQSGQPNS